MIFEVLIFNLDFAPMAQTLWALETSMCITLANTHTQTHTDTHTHTHTHNNYMLDLHSKYTLLEHIMGHKQISFFLKSMLLKENISSIFFFPLEQNEGLLHIRPVHSCQLWQTYDSSTIFSLTVLCHI